MATTPMVVDDVIYHYRNGLCHRDDDLPAIIHPNGRKAWFRKGLRHRDYYGLPAVIHDCHVEYWRGGVQYTPTCKKL